MIVLASAGPLLADTRMYPGWRKPWPIETALNDDAADS